MGANQNEAKTLHEKYFGADWINSIPAKWRSTLRYFVDKTPGVANTTEPDAIEGDVVSSELSTNRTNELERKTTRLMADLLTNSVAHGQNWNEKFGFVTPYREYVTLDNAEVGEPGREINPFNPKLSEVRSFDTSALVPILETFVLPFPGVANLSSRLPDILLGIDIVDERTSGDGDYDEDADRSDFELFHWSLTTTGSAQGSASIIPQAVPRISEPSSAKGNRAVPTMKYLFFMATPVDGNDISDRLTELLGQPILPWPKFDDTRCQVTITGERLSLEVNTKAHRSVGEVFFAGIKISGKGHSEDRALIVRVLDIPPTIHGQININDAIISEEVTVASKSVIPSDFVSGILEVTNSRTGTVTATVSPAGFEATAISDIPREGLHLLDSDSEPFISSVDDDGNVTHFVMCHAEVVDMQNVTVPTAGAPI